MAKSKTVSKKATKATESATKTETKKDGEKEETKLLKINRKDAAALLEAIGFKETRKYTNDLLTKRLGKLKTYMESYEGTLTGDQSELKDKIIAAGPEGFTVTGEEPKGAKETTPDGKPTSGGKKASGTGGKKTPKGEPGQPREGTASAIIIEKLQKGPISREDLHKILMQKFPDRNSDSVMSTVRTLVPSDLRNLKGYDVQKDDKGRYFIPQKK